MTQAYIVTECPSDGEILKTLLPKSLTQEIEFFNSDDAESVASSLLVSRRLPVVMVTNSQSNHNLTIWEQEDTLKYLMRQAAAGRPFKVLMAIPHVEVVFFQDRELLEGWIDRQLTDLEWHLGRRNPKDLLELLPGGSAQFVARVLDSLSEVELQVLQQHPLMQDLMTFLERAMSGSKNSTATVA